MRALARIGQHRYGASNASRVERSERRIAMAQQSRRMKTAVVALESAPAAPVAPSGWSIETVFGAGRPTAPRRGLEPAFVLFESHIMDALRRRAAGRGLAYDALVRQIVRDHVDEY
jgi:hypothetical protein